MSFKHKGNPELKLKGHKTPAMLADGLWTREQDWHLKPNLFSQGNGVRCPNPL